jgi:hypothetical protein
VANNVVFGTTGISALPQVSRSAYRAAGGWLRAADWRGSGTDDITIDLCNQFSDTTTD